MILPAEMETNISPISSRLLKYFAQENLESVITNELKTEPHMNELFVKD